MLIKLGITLTCAVFFFSEACGPKTVERKSAAPDAEAASSLPPTSSASERADGPAFDACALLDKSEVATVQGVEVQHAQPTTQRSGDLNISQCYYTAISADGSKNFSVYVQVIQQSPNAAETRALKEFWEERFERESDEKRKEERAERARGEEEEEAINPPVRVSGLGDKAFWLGSSRGGALFVLKKDRVLRITVGVADDASAKAQLEKSKTLANKALARLM